MDIESNNNFFNGSDEVEEEDNNLSFNECEDDEVEEEEVEEPKKGMCFSSKEEVYAFYAEYAKHSGFAIAYRSQNLTCDGEVKYFGIECTRARNRTKRSEINPLEPSLSSKNECKARVRASLQKDGTYKLTTVVVEHTHDLVATDSWHFAMNKRIVTPVKRRLEVNDAAGIGVAKNFHSIVVEAGGYEALTFDERDARNYINNARKLRLGVGDAESVTHYFHKMQQQNSNFYSAIDLDEDGRMRNLFWADARSRAAYKAFGDVVCFDTTYLTNKYDMPFAPFVGVNHHGQSILFGCGLLSNENTDTFVWLFKEWLSCMSDAPPKAIITEPRKLTFPCMRVVQDTMYEPVPPSQHYYRPSMDAIADPFLVPAPVTTSGDNIGSTSHQEAGIVNNISSERSMVPSYFVDLNIDGDPNLPFFF